MEFVIEKDKSYKQAFKALASATSKDFPACRTVLVRTETDCVTFSSTDLTEYVQIKMRASVVSMGEVLVDAKALSATMNSILSSSGKSGIRITLRDELIVQSDTLSVNLPVSEIPASEFIAEPVLGDVDAIIQVPSKHLKETLKCAWTAVSKNSNRPILKTVSIKLQDGETTVRSADDARGHIVSMASDVDENSSDGYWNLCGGKMVSYLPNTLLVYAKMQMAVDYVLVTWRDKGVEWSTYISTAVWRYPSIEDLRVEAVFSVDVDAKAFKSIASTFVESAKHRGYASFVPVVMSHSPQGLALDMSGIYHTKMPVLGTSKPDVDGKLVIDFKYVLDFMKNVKTETVELNYSGTSTAYRLVSGNMECLIMPMSVDINGKSVD